MSFIRGGLFALLAGAAVLSLACAGGDRAGAATPAPSEGADSGRGIPVPAGRMLLDAPIHDVEIVVRETMPRQYAAVVVSGLPTGCTTYWDATLQRDGTTIVIAVKNSAPAVATECADIAGTTEHTIDLGYEFRKGTEYTIRVNDYEETFIGQ